MNHSNLKSVKIMCTSQLLIVQTDKGRKTVDGWMKIQGKISRSKFQYLFIHNLPPDFQDEYMQSI